jgi:hypothetical protein
LSFYAIEFHKLQQQLTDIGEPDAWDALEQIEFYHRQNLEAIQRPDFRASRKAVEAVNDLIDTKLKPRSGPNFIYNTDPTARCFARLSSNDSLFESCMKNFANR